MGITKKQRVKLQQKALNMYLTGESLENIAHKLKVSEKTMKTWAKKGEWKKYLDETQEKLIQKLPEDIAEEKARSLKLIRATEALYAQKLQSNEIDMNAQNFASLQRVKWEILMPKTISQYNFLKKEETNIGLTKEELNRLLEVL